MTDNMGAWGDFSVAMRGMMKHATHEEGMGHDQGDPGHVTTGDAKLLQDLQQWGFKQAINAGIGVTGTVAVYAAGLAPTVATLAGAAMAATPYFLAIVGAVKTVRAGVWVTRQLANLRLKGDAKFTRNELLNQKGWGWLKPLYYFDEGVNNASKWVLGVVCTGDLRPSAQRIARPFPKLPLATPLRAPKAATSVVEDAAPH